MIFSDKFVFKFRNLFRAFKKSNRGAITVEYALTMFLAAVLMVGVELMFRRLATDIIVRFKDIVSMFPNI
jgi:Flp pilus assembly pilin Flp